MYLPFQTEQIIAPVKLTFFPRKVTEPSCYRLLICWCITVTLCVISVFETWWIVCMMCNPTLISLGRQLCWILQNTFSATFPSYYIRGNQCPCICKQKLCPFHFYYVDNLANTSHEENQWRVYFLGCLYKKKKIVKSELVNTHSIL